MRTCACGCGTDLDAIGKRRDALYAGESHRERVRRDKDSNPRGANLVRESAGTAPPRRNQSGLQVAYRKAVTEVANHLYQTGTAATWTGAHRQAARVLRPALSDRQRAQLDGREPR